MAAISRIAGARSAESRGRMNTSSLLRLGLFADSGSDVNGTDLRKVEDPMLERYSLGQSGPGSRCPKHQKADQETHEGKRGNSVNRG